MLSRFVPSSYIPPLSIPTMAVSLSLSPAIFSLLRRVSPTLHQSEASKGLLLVDDPQPVALALVAYVSVVLLGLLVIKAFKLKPREKEPRLLLMLVLLHNTFLFSLSLFMAVAIPLEAIRLRYSLFGNAPKEAEQWMARLIHLFYLSKYIEFGDTIIMLLRCSVRQISFLHVYHHATIMPIWWICTYQGPGGEAYFSATLNSAVHVAMYGYYALAAMIGKNESARRKYLFWGRYLTQAQMIQFVLNVFQASYDLYIDSGYPRWITKLYLYYMLTLLALFGHFYATKYTKPLPRKKGD